MTGERVGYGRQRYGARGNPRSGVTLVLAAGQKLRDLVFKMSQPAAISGRVLDEDGEPVSRMLAGIFEDSYVNGKRQYQFRPGALTAADGTYRMEGVPVGQYRLRAGKAGVLGEKVPAGPGQVYDPTYYPHSSSLATAAAVQIGFSTEVTGIDIRMFKTKDFRIKGKVVGLPAGARVAVGLGSRDVECHPTFQERVEIPAEGSFAFSDTPPGSYWLAVYGQSSTPNVLRPIEIADEPIEDIVLPYAPLVAVRGRVSAEQPIPKGLKIRADAEDRVSTSSSPVAEDGTFTLKGIHPGNHAISVDGLGGGYVKSVKYAGRDGTDDCVYLGGGTDLLEITQSAAGAQVYGAVRDRDDKPVSGATVALIPDSSRHSLYRSASADQNGAFTIKGIAPGEYKVLAWEDIEPGAYEDPEVLKPVESKADALSPKKGEQKSVSLRAMPGA